MADTNTTATTADFRTAINLPTAAAVKEAIGAMGIDPNSEAAKLLVKLGAPARQAKRVETVIATVKAAEKSQAEADDAFGVRCHLASAAAILVADMVGVGGQNAMTGESTLRVRSLRSLGKGRKQATDGHVWDAAIKAAYCQILAEAGAVKGYVGVDFDAADVHFGFIGSNPEGNGYAYFDEVVEKAWIRSIAGRVLLALAAGYGCIQLTVDTAVDITCSAQKWAEAFNAVADAKPAPDAE